MRRRVTAVVVASALGVAVAAWARDLPDRGAPVPVIDLRAPDVEEEAPPSPPAVVDEPAGAPPPTVEDPVAASSSPSVREGAPAVSVAPRPVIRPPVPLILDDEEDDDDGNDDDGDDDDD